MMLGGNPGVENAWVDYICLTEKYMYMFISFYMTILMAYFHNLLSILSYSVI